MSNDSPDSILVSAFTDEASEDAFRALVARHANLVYATALRQTGDPATAEDITQNVFVILARKAPRLRGCETLTGWLHRTAVFESKSKIRAELRRRRREITAFENLLARHEGDSPLETLVPWVDEALLSLREHDRLALVARFFEKRSLKEIGATLGIDENTAGKRVSRALEKLSHFFQKKGFTISTGAAAAMLGTAGAEAAPAGLAISLVPSALSAAAPLSGNLFVATLTSASPFQFTALCVFLVAGPAVWQWRAEARNAEEQSRLRYELAALEKNAAAIVGMLQRTSAAADRAEEESRRLATRISEVQQLAKSSTPRSEYRWDENSPVARVPKGIIRGMPLSAVAGKRGKLTDQIKEALQLTETETERTEAAIARFLAGYHAWQAGSMREIVPTKADLGNRSAEDTRVFEVTGAGSELPARRAALFAELQPILGPDRFEIFREAMVDWIPIDDRGHGMNTGQAIFEFDHHVRFYRPKPGEVQLGWGIGKSNGEMMSATIEVEEIPEIFRDRLSDWIEEAKANAAKSGL
jgi:RNA polymerase sigma factor (sigma-70 family)